MATEFVCTVGWSGPPTRDFKQLSLWSITCHCDLTAASTKVFSSTKHTGTKFGVQDGRLVYLYRGGILQDCKAWFLHATETQTLVRDISGTVTPQAGDQWRQTADNTYGWVTINNAGDSAIAVAKCYKDGDMRDIISLIGWQTNSVNRLKLYAPASEIHSGKAGTGFRIYGVGWSDTLLYLEDVDILIQGIEFQGGGRQVAGTYRYGIHTLEIERCLFYDNVWGPAIDVPSNSYLTTEIWNCIFYNSYSTTIGPGHYAANVHVENCSVYNPGSYGVFRAECYNVVVHRGTHPEFPCFGDECTGDYNCDGVEVGTDNSAPGVHSLHNKTLAEIAWIYSELNPPVEGDLTEIDLHVYPDGFLVGRGVDRSSRAIGFNTDIDGDIRTVPWTIGADQKTFSSSSSSSLGSSSSSLSSSSISSHSSSSASTFYLELRDITYNH